MKRLYLTAFLLLLYGTGIKAELYKYINEDGVVVLGSSIPPKYVKNGYVVLTPNGRVVKVVPKAMTLEEEAEQQKKEAEKTRLAEERKAQEERDIILLRLYSGPEDVNSARDAKLASIDSMIENSRADLIRLQERKKRLVAEAVELERSGDSVSSEYLKTMLAVDEQVSIIKLEIERKLEEKEETRASFNLDNARVAELYGIDQDGIGQDDTDQDALDKDGIDQDALVQDALDQDGIDQDGIGQDGIDQDALDKDGIDQDTLVQDALDQDGIDQDGIDRAPEDSGAKE